MNGPKNIYLGFHKQTGKPQLLISHGSILEGSHAVTYKNFTGPFTNKEAKKALREVKK